jgi:hypothetical protein
MTNDCLDTRRLAQDQKVYPGQWCDQWTGLSTAAVITYIGPLDGDDRESSNTAEPVLSYRRVTMPKRTCPRCRKRRQNAFTARARRQRRKEIAEFEALPIVRRARAAGLHGEALCAYVSAVEALDGPWALLE